MTLLKRISVIAALTMSVAPIMAQDATEANVYQELERFGAVFDQVQRDYVEEVDVKELVDAAIDGMLTSLDPHSSYLGSDAFTDMQESTSGEFAGLGIEVTQENGAVKVVAPIDDTPAASAGLESGDYITHVDGTTLLGLSLDESVGMLRGPVGSTITITVFREGLDEPFDVEITRDIVKSRSAKARTIGNVGILRLAKFDAQTFPNMKEGIEEVIDELGGIENVEGFVIDLRNNPGGLLSSSIEISDAFLEQGEIVSTRGRHESDSGRANARKGDLTQGKPLVVLINGGSASASEIVAGALKDQERAVVVGTPSFGKGSVQTLMPLGEDSAIRLTTARYYTPSGRSIQGLGVEPDVFVEQRPFVEKDDEPKSQAFNPVNEGDLPGALNNDSVTDEEAALIEEDRLARQAEIELRDTDFQLAYALDVLHGIHAYVGKK